MSEIQTLKYELGDWDDGALRVLLRLETMPRDLRWFRSLW